MVGLSKRVCLEGRRSTRAVPSNDLGRVFVVHIEEVSHGRSSGRDALVVEDHCHEPSEELQFWAVPVFDHFVVRRQILVDEVTQALTDALPFERTVPPPERSHGRSGRPPL
jgi:hypothetical protein